MLPFGISSTATEEFPSTIQIYCPSSPFSSCLMVRVDVRLDTMLPLGIRKDTCEVDLLMLTWYFSGDVVSMGLLLLLSHTGGSVDLRNPCTSQVNTTFPSSKYPITWSGRSTITVCVEYLDISIVIIQKYYPQNNNMYIIVVSRVYLVGSGSVSLSSFPHPFSASPHNYTP